MLNTEFVVRPHDRPLEEAPDALCGVGVNVGMDPFFLTVVDGAVLGVVVADSQIRLPLIGVDLLGFVMDILHDDSVPERGPAFGGRRW